VAPRKQHDQYSDEVGFSVLSDTLSSLDYTHRDLCMCRVQIWKLWVVVPLSDFPRCPDAV
jgi:hypothetical protein